MLRSSTLATKRSSRRSRGAGPARAPGNGYLKPPEGEPAGLTEGRPEHRHGLLICLALAVATLAVYWQVTGFDFVAYDDLSYVQETPQVRAGLTAPGIAWALRAG